VPSLTTTPHHCERLNATIEILAKDKMFLITAQRPVHNLRTGSNQCFMPDHRLRFQEPMLIQILVQQKSNRTI